MKQFEFEKQCSNLDDKYLDRLTLELRLFLLSTQGRGRTGTILLSLVFETNASTNSATWATLWEISPV